MHTGRSTYRSTHGQQRCYRSLLLDQICIRSSVTQGRVVPTWADVLNRANLGMEVMHERNAHNFPLDLAAAESTPIALLAPAIG